MAGQIELATLALNEFHNRLLQLSKKYNIMIERLDTKLVFVSDVEENKDEPSKLKFMYAVWASCSDILNRHSGKVNQLERGLCESIQIKSKE